MYELYLGVGSWVEEEAERGLPLQLLETHKTFTFWHILETLSPPAEWREMHCQGAHLKSVKRTGLVNFDHNRVAKIN